MLNGHVGPVAAHMDDTGTKSTGAQRVPGGRAEGSVGDVGASWPVSPEIQNRETKLLLGLMSSRMGTCVRSST